MPTIYKIMFFFSLALFVAAVVAFASFGLNVGVDFKGGSVLELEFSGGRPTVDEITGAAKIMRKFVTGIATRHKKILDTCGTGGDERNTFNVSTVAAFVAAGAGVVVAKSGEILRWPWVELTATPTPANPYASIAAMKSLDPPPLVNVEPSTADEEVDPLRRRLRIVGVHKPS